MINGRINRLLIAAPPGSAKSTYTSLLAPAWFLGQFPSKMVVAASHTADFAESWGGKVRNLILSKQYANVFPHTGISKDTKSKGLWATTRGGEYFAVGVGGSVTGRRADLIIVDDPFRGRADADSKARRELVDNWYKADLYTRMKPGCGIILIATRWHPDDLSGRLLKASLEGTGDKWHTLILEAVCEDVLSDPLGRKYGEALWPEWQDVPALMGIKNAVSLREWEALYMQRPAPLDGGMVKKEWFKRYKKLPNDDKPRITQSWDTGSSASERADPSVCTTWAQYGHNHYLLDVWRKQVEFPDLLAAVKSQANIYQPQAVLIEDRGSGQQLNQLLYGGNWAYNVIKIQPQKQGGKEFRFDLVTPMFQSGKVYIPDKEDKWVEDYMFELLTFPNNANDDQVDSTSQYLSWAMPRSKRGMSKLVG